MVCSLSSALERYFPAKLKPSTANQATQLQNALQDKWTQLKGKSDEECQHIYLHNTSDWPHFCATFYPCEQSFFDKLPTKIVLGVKHDGICVFNTNMVLLFFCCGSLLFALLDPPALSSSCFRFISKSCRFTRTSRS